MDSKLRLNRKHLIFVIVLSAVLFVGFIISTYALLNKEARKMVKKYTDELAIHDMMTIEMFVSDRWLTMEGMYADLRLRKFYGIEELLDELSMKNCARDIDHCYLIDNEGKLYSDVLVVYEKEQNPLYEYFQQDASPFVVRYDDQSLFVETQKKYMLYGMNFDKPIIVYDKGNEIKMVGMAALNNISKIRGRLRITCFDNHGYASIIDENGYYIVPDEESTITNQYQNFYEIISQRKISGTTIEEIKKNVSEQNDVNFWCATSEGVKRFVSVYSIKNSNWSFVIALDEYVFSNQINSFIQLLTAIFAVLLGGIFLIFFAVYRTRKKLNNMYASVAKGVYNRQYYDEKLIGERINALAIMDLDHLKIINDSYGHLAGDVAIKRVAEVIASHASERGIVCRFGGDEFVVVFPDNLSEELFEEILENIRAEIRESEFTDYPELKISMSIGGFYGDGFTNEMLKKADDLLYKAKSKRNSVVTNIEKIENKES